MLSLIKRWSSDIKGLIAEALGVAISREKQKQLLGVSLYRNASYLIVASLALPLTGFIFWIIAARFYPAEAVGFASAIIAVMTLVAYLSTLGLDFGLVRFLAHSGSNASRMLNTSFTVGSLTAIVLCGIFIAGISVWSPALIVLRQNPIYLAAFIVFTMVSTLSFLLSSAFIAQRYTRSALVKNLIFGLLRVPLAIVLSIFFQTFGIFVSWGVSAAVALIIGLLFLLPRTQPGYRLLPTINRGILGEMMRFSFANYIASISWLLPGLVLPVIVLHLLGAELNAYFAIAWSIGDMLPIIPFSIAMSLFAEGSFDEQNLVANTRRAFKLTFLILVPAVIILLITADKLLLLFGGAYSQNGTALLRIMAVAAFPVAVNCIYMGIKRVEKKLAILIKLSVPIFIATLTVTYLLLPRTGIIGPGIAWLGSQGVVAAGIGISFLVRQPELREKMNRVKVSLWGKRK